ncbi:hypothetical protein [Candidatus Leptofilum sp.]|uniref:hypothetical protein n=1 Tax=Candidatus Leptofilum sp. TaxID=3241576 RepID=UPI003B5C0449
MDRLERDFSAEIDFFLLDVDIADSRLYMDEYAIRTRSTYVLLNAAGEEVMRWNGPLDGNQVTADIISFLDNTQ